MKKTGGIISVIAVLIIVVLINVVSSFKFGRLDLTEEKIHSLSDKTIALLENDSVITDELKFEIYLDGEDLPPELRKLQLAIKEKLNEFRAYGGNKIYYEFINPSEDQERKNEVHAQIQEQGLYPTIISTFGNDSKKDMIVFGGIIIRSTTNNIAPVQILQPSFRPVQIPTPDIEKAINDIEYYLLEGIYKVTAPERKRIGFLQGHGELTEMERIDVTYELSKFHVVEDVKINEKFKALDKLDALVIAKPTQPISDKDQYIIDQFIMRGGKVAWLIDPVDVTIDSLISTGQTIGLERNLNKIDRQIFSYGARINKDLVIDANSAYLYFQQGSQREKWFYYPLIDTWREKNPIVNNVDPIKLEYASTIDLLKNEGIKKTPLLITSDLSLKYNVPVRINYQMIKLDTTAIKYSAKPYQIMAAMLEGQFDSYFKNRLTDNFVSNPLFKHEDKSKETKMLVIGDGDLIRNDVDSIKNARGQLVARPLNINRDRYDYRIKYGNRVFFVNAIESMLGITDLMPLRSKSITLRPLDQGKIAKDKGYWQMLNVVLPILIVIAFGMLHFFMRKRRFA